MALQFNPYPILDPNQYRKPTLQEKLAPVNEGINNALQLYQQSRQNHLQDINQAIALQWHRRPDGSSDFESGSTTPSTSLGVTTKPQPTPLFGSGQPDSMFSSPQPMTSQEPKPLFASAGTPDTGFSFQPGNPYNMPQQPGPTQPNMPPAPRAMGMPAPAQPTPAQPGAAQPAAAPAPGPNFGAMSPYELQNFQTRQKAQTDLQQSQQNMDPNSDLTRTKQTLATKFIPGQDFSKMTGSQIDQLMPMLEKYGAAELTKQYRDALLSSKTGAVDTKEQDQQDRLEQQARQQIVGIRGDASLKRVEDQRDAAIIAYNRIQEIKNSGKQINPVDYTDILGQIYKARTGAAPTEQVLSEIRQATAKGQLGKAYTYITGQQAPATTQDIANSLENMAVSMGQQADKLHEGYMNTHLQFPTRLNPQTADSLRKQGRGFSFSEATGYSGADQITPDVAAYAQKHGITPQQALQIKMQRTGGR